MSAFTEAEIASAKAALDKPAPMDALRMVASGRGLFQLTDDRRDILIMEWDGKPIIDPEFPDRRGALLGGGWALYRAGMVDEYCTVTRAGRAALDAGPRTI